MNGHKRQVLPDRTSGNLHAGIERFGRIFAVFAVAALLLANGGGAAVLAAVPDRQVETLVQHDSHEACAQPAARHARCLANISTRNVVDPIGASAPGTSGFGYGPSEFHTAYQLPCTPGGAIAGVCSTPATFGPQTIAIVDAGNYSIAGSTLESALHTYDSYYGLPECTAANGCLNVINQTGGSTLPPNVSGGWSDEIALDVETAHMICQTCKITLVEASDDFVNNLAIAEQTAAALQPIAISNSWGATSDATGYDSYFKYSGIAVVAATGDGGTASSGQSWPADIPEVVAAAGTTLQLNTDKTWANETVWANSGGGCSTTYTAPSWQTSRSDWAAVACPGNGRSFGDLSADGDPSTGAAIVLGSSWYIAGGTSLSTPLIAAMYALADDLPSGTNAVTIPYSNASASVLHDIIAGNDCATGGQLHCTAQAGFDTPSGLGSPRGLGLFQANPQYIAADINQDGHVNLLDLSILSSKYAQSGSSLGRADMNQDGQVNLLDLSILSSKYGTE